MNSSSAARARSRSQRRSGASTPAPLALHPVRAGRRPAGPIPHRARLPDRHGRAYLSHVRGAQATRAAAHARGAAGGTPSPRAAGDSCGTPDGHDPRPAPARARRSTAAETEPRWGAGRVFLPRRGRKAMSRGARAAVLLGAALLGAGCSASQPRRTPRVPIVVARAEARAVPYERDATGTVEPLESAAVTAQVGGLVTRVAFPEGDEVGTGRVLFQIDPRSFEAALAKSPAELARDRAQAQNAELDLKRAEALAAQQLIAPGDLDQKRSAAEALSSQAGADSAAVAAARLDLSHATIRAPIAGKTGNVSVP